MEARDYLLEHGSGTIADPRHIGSLRAKWGSVNGGKLLKGLNPRMQSAMAQLYENQSKYMPPPESTRLHENTTTGTISSFAKYIFPILRRVFPNLISPEIMSFQPMSASTGAVFFFEMKYANAKAGLASGDNLIEKFSEYYTAEYNPEEPIGTGDGALVTFSGNLNWFPVRPKSTSNLAIKVVVTDGTETFEDNGTGTLTGDDGGTGTINYTTGQISVTFNAAPADGDVIKVSYYTNSEGNAQVPEMYFEISKQLIEAESRKIKARWTAEAADEMRDMHGVDAEVEVLSGFANQLALEIDRENIDLLVSGAGSSTTWDYDPTTWDNNDLVAVQNLVYTIKAASAAIHTKTKRGAANFIVTTPEVEALFSMLNSHNDYKPSELSVERAASYGALNSDFGVYQSGVLANRIRVFVDPYLSRGSSTKTILLGLKGQNFYDAGAAYCPYIPMEVTPSFTDPDDWVTRRGMRTRSKSVMLRPEYYATIGVTGLLSLD